MAATNTASVGASRHPSRASTVSAAAPSIVVRSPNRCTSAPAGMSAMIWPTPAAATTSAAIAGDAPRSVAVITTTGAIAP